MAAADDAQVAEVLAAVPEDRRPLVEALRTTIVDNLPDGFVETVQWGMLAYVVPLEDFPDTYNGQALQIAALANQKAAVSLYLMGVYGSEALRQWFVDAWTATGTKLDMGKSCIRVKRLDAVPLDVVAGAIRRVTPADLIAAHEAAHGARRR